MGDPRIILSHKRATCPSCRRGFEAGSTWPGANFCRGSLLLQFIKDSPGLSEWQLSQISNLAYVDATRGLAKLRDYEAVLAEPEDRGDGSYRYRYWPNGDITAREHFLAALRRAEAL